MKSVGGAGLVVLGFLFLYLAITGRLDCFFAFVSCATGAGNPVTTGSGTTNGGGGGGGGLQIDWGGIVNNALCRNGRNIVTGGACTGFGGGTPQATPPIAGH